MGFGAGHVIDMMNRMKQNRSQMPSKRTQFNETNKQGDLSTDKDSRQLNFKTVSEQELDEIKKDIQMQAKAERKKDLKLVAVLFAVGLILMIGIWIWLS